MPRRRPCARFSGSSNPKRSRSASLAAARDDSKMRAWEAFARDYAERQAGGDEWVRELLDRHFARAYALALVRAKRNTQGRNEG